MTTIRLLKNDCTRVHFNTYSVFGYLTCSDWFSSEISYALGLNVCFLQKGGVWRLVDALRSLNPLRRDSATRWQEQELVRVTLSIQLDFSLV